MKYLSVVSALALVALALAEVQDQDVQLWNLWKEKYNKVYGNQVEEYTRYQNFLQNAQKVKQHNLEESFGKHTFTLTLNHLADLTEEEYKASMLTPLRPSSDSTEAKTLDSTLTLPASQDWRDKGVVTDVKNQGQCGSCWSFAGTGALEAQYALKHDTLLSFSEQQQVDCNTRCYGCDGGWAEQAFFYWETTGSNLESDYPYQAQQYNCRTSGKKTYATVSSYFTLQKGNETALQFAVAYEGPIAIAIDASHSSFQMYNGGIYYESACNPQNLDHAVLAVGYGSNASGDYWIVKNSWGASWGDQGYIMMARNANNNCGVASDCSYPEVA